MLGSSTLPELINFQALQSYQNVNVSIRRAKQLRIPSGGDLFLGLEDSRFFGSWEMGILGRFVMLGNDFWVVYVFKSSRIFNGEASKRLRFRDSSHIFVVYLRVWFSKRKCQLPKKSSSNKFVFLGVRFTLGRWLPPNSQPKTRTEPTKPALGKQILTPPTKKVQFYNKHHILLHFLSLKNIPPWFFIQQNFQKNQRKNIRTSRSATSPPYSKRRCDPWRLNGRQRYWVLQRDALGDLVGASGGQVVR